MKFIKTKRTLTFMTALAVAVCAAASGCNGSKTKMNAGEAKPDVIAFAAPDEYPQYDVKYIVKVDGQDAGVYSDKNSWKKSINFSNFELREGKTATVEVTPLFKYETFKILPDKYGIKATRNGNSLRFEVSDSKAKLSLVFDDNYLNTTLHLFVNPIDDNAPTESTDDIIYFGPGYHRARNDITPDSGQTVYLANGAVVSGHIEIAYVENVTVKGSGIIMKDDKSIGSGRAINVTQSKNIKISGIISNIHRNNDWTTRIHRSSEVTLDNYKVVSPEWASTDGVDIVNCNNININDCFLRATDDTITIKGIADDAVIGEALDSPPANEKINVTNTILWNECNSAMVVGEETQAKYYKDIHFKNIDVIFSYDDIEYHNSLYERSVMSIINGLGNPMEDISWEDIRVNECERLICFAFIDEFYTIPVNPETCQILPGYMKNITVKNVVSNSTSNGAYANQIYLKGWDANKNISNVTFDNIVIKGEKLTESSPLIVKNEFVNNLEVK